MSAEALVGGDVRLKSGRGRWVLVTAVLGSGIAQLDGTVVNVALPRIGKDLHASLAALQWTVNGYMLTLAGLILLGGSLGDRFGRRRLFVIGTVWFALASAVCGIAPNVAVLIGARTFQGIGGALLTPGSLALIQATYQEADRSRAVGAWSGLGGVSAAVGPFLGGYLVDGPGWRWIFLINLPVAVVAVGIAQRWVPETRDEGEVGGFDVTGAALAALALAALTYALVDAPTRGVLGHRGRRARRDRPDGGVHPARETGPAAHDAARPVLLPVVQLDQRDHAVPVRAAGRRLLPAAGATADLQRLRRAAGRSRHPADHRDDAAAVRPVGSAGRADRRPTAAHRGPVGGRGRHPDALPGRSRAGPTPPRCCPRCWCRASAWPRSSRR